MAVTYEVDQQMLNDVVQKLGKLKGQAPVAISRALNKTAVTAREDLVKQAQNVYTIKTGGFKKGMTIKRASYRNLEAIIRSKGRPTDIIKFNHDFPKSGSGGRQEVIAGKGLQTIIGPRKIKAFKGPHGQMFQRQTKNRLPIKKLMSNSVPKMIGNEEKVYGKVKPVIDDNLKKYMEAQIGLIVDKGGVV